MSGPAGNLLTSIWGKAVNVCGRAGGRGGDVKMDVCETEMLVNVTAFDTCGGKMLTGGLP